MKKQTGFLSMAVLAALLAGGNALAQQGRGEDRLDRLFSQIDRDASGTLTVQEMRAAAAARFNALDINGDGRVHPEERRQSRDNRLKIHFDRADRDGNGKLDAKEMHEVARQRTDRRMAQLDRDGDGMLSLEEMHRAPPGPLRMHEHGDRALTLEVLDAQMMAMFRQADTNGDGVVTLKEAMAGSAR